MKVLFVYSDPLCSCTRIRTFEVVKALKQYKKDINVDVAYFLYINEEAFKKYDIILFQRLGGNSGIISKRYIKELFELINKYKKETICIYDIDDFIFHWNNNLPINLIKNVQWALSPNRFLESIQKQWNNKTYIIKTHIDIDFFNSISAHNIGNKINIGWVSVDGLGIELMAKVLPVILNKYKDKVNIHFFSLNFYNEIVKRIYKSENFISHGLVQINELTSYIKSFDFMINPFDINQYTMKRLNVNTENEINNYINSKSEIKFVKAGAAKIPLIASPNPAYKEAMINNFNGLIANSANEWIDCISTLIENKKHRSLIGENAYNYIIKNYTLLSVADNYYNFFKKAINNE